MRRYSEARECGGEGGKPGPCPENHSEGTHHGVGGTPHPEDVHEANSNINRKTGTITPHQAQVHADLQSIAGEHGIVRPSRHGSNRPDHGAAGALSTRVTFEGDSTEANQAKAKRLREYADRNGLSITRVTHTDEGLELPEWHTEYELRAPKEPPNDRQKDVMRMRNAALNDGEDTPLHTLSDKLEEMGAPFAGKLSELVNSGDYDGARKAIVAQEYAYGSVLTKGTGRKSEIVEAVMRRKRHQRYLAVEDVDASKGFRIDKKAGIIYNVLILGNKAKNGRRYLKEAKESAVKRGLYENLQLYIGPHKKGRFAKRSPNNHAGELRNVKVLPNEEVRGNVHYNRVSHGGRLLVEIAERFPQRFGLSQHAWVDGYEEGGEKLITEIAEIAVIDLVKDPGTTDNIFEDVDMPEEAVEDGEVATDPTPSASDTPTDGPQWQQNVKDLIASIHDDDGLDDDTKMAATKLAMKLKKLLSGDDDTADDGADAADDTDAGEAVDAAELLKRIEALEKPKAKPAPPAPKPRPKSSARTETTESVTQEPKKKVFPKKREDILAAYDVDNED